MSDKNAIVDAIVKITQVMSVDFKKDFESIFQDVETLRRYKNRLYRSLRDANPVDVADGYEIFFDSSRGKCPTVQELSNCVSMARNLRKQKESQKEQIEKAGRSNDVHKIDCEPLKMLSKAKEAYRVCDGSGLVKGEALAAHNALLTIHANNIFHPHFGAEHACASPFCKNLGSDSTNTRGGGPFFCSECAKKLRQ